VSEENNDGLPAGWESVSLAALCQINPPLDRCVTSDAVEVNFVPMRAVESEGAGLVRPEVRRYGEVKKGYTSFLSGDVIMAKITPCMENGKTTVVPPLPASICFGSTEFHVVRPESGVLARWIAGYLVQHEVRRNAQRAMTGGVGQMRVPAAFLESLRIPIAPTAEQERISDALDELLSDLDAGLAAVERVREKVKLYRAAVLKAAVEGALTAEWRKEHPQTEPSSELLKRILTERRRRWEEEQLRKFKEKGREPPKNWKAKYKEPVAPNTTDLPRLPEGWCWVTVEQLATVTSGQTPPGMPSTSTPGDGVLWFRVADMNAPGNEGWMQNGGLRLGFDSAKSLGVKLLPAGSIIFPKRGGAIATNKKRRLKFAAGCDLNLMAVTPVAPAGEYLWLWFLALDLAKLSDGSNVPQINNPDIVPRAVPLPPLVEQQAIVEAVDGQLSVIDHLESEFGGKLNSAQALRQSVLRHAFSGKLVLQDPKDEPASELLKRIAAEREERARESAATKRPNGPKPRRSTKLRGKAARAKTPKKDIEHGRIADR
jgi:type I restriction enzyme S subunit